MAIDIDVTSDIWVQAVKSWETATGETMNAAKYRNMSMEDMTANALQSVTRFEDSRHDKSKTSRVRQAFGKHIGDMQKVLGIFRLAGNAASMFPPASPAGLLFAAAGRALEAFGMVSADYDEITAFYNKLAKFFDHLLVIEKRAPKDEPFKRSVTLVFACQLDVLGIAHQYAGEKNPKRKRGLRLPHMPRTEKWLAALWEGQNPDLMKACTKMEMAINDLRQLIGLEIFSVVQDMFINQQEALETQQAVKQELGEVNAGLEKINLTIREKGLATEKGLGGIVAALGQVRADLKAQFDKPKAQIQQSAKTDVKDKGLLAQNTIIKAFNDSLRFDGWDLARAQLRAEIKRASSVRAELTCTWFTDDNISFKAWVSGERPILFLHGNEGMGKTFTAHAVVSHLTRNDGTSSVARFCVREDSPEVHSKDNGLACIVWQIARSNSRYCQLVAADLGTIDIDECDWNRLIAKHFASGSKDRLFLILDGIDEMHPLHTSFLLEELAMMTKENAMVSVLLTSRQRVSPDVLESSMFFEVHLTKKEIWRDMTRLIEARCETLPRLSTFPRRIRLQILKILREKADGMLYIEHMLRRLDYIGRENAVLRDLKDAPKDLHALYSRMVLECHTNRSPEQSEALRHLFAWLAFSKRPLTLSEAGALMRELVKNGMYDIEEEVIGRSTRLLGVAKRLDYDDNDEEDDGLEEGEESNADDPIADIDIEYFDNGGNVLQFHERSLREFFCTAESDSEGLRTPAHIAHFKIFLLTTRIMMDSSMNTDADKNNKLLGYAANYWTDHFKELDIERLGTEELVSVIRCLHRVTTSTDHIPSLFEMYSDADKVYPGTRELLSETWLNNLENVLAKASTLPYGALEFDVLEWIESLAHERRSVLLPLARGHMQNWFNGKSTSDICTAFGYLAAALDISTSDLENIWNAINAILITWPDLDISSDVGAHRAIATILWIYGQLPKHNSEAIEWFSRACYLQSEDQHVERFHTLWLLAQLHNESYRWEESVDCMDKALAALPADWKKDELLITRREDLFHAKAETLRDLRQFRLAIGAYQEARLTSHLLPSASPDAKSLTDQLLLVWEQDNTRHNFLSCLRQWTDVERREWLKYVITSNSTASNDCVSHFHESSKKEGAKGLEFLMFCYDDLEGTLAPRSPEYFALRASKANAYKDVMHNVIEAKKLYKGVLYSKVREEGLNQVASTRSEVRNALAMLIFNDFRSSSDPLAKKSLLEEMRRLDDPHKSSLEPEQSNTDVMCALMLRTLGPSSDFQAYMDKTFKVCIAGIKDGLDWNDRSSFRLLAKVLACMEGLEQEALIALSCQFSRIDNTESSSPNDNDEGSSLTSETHTTAEPDTKIMNAEQGNEASGDTEETETLKGTSAKSPVPRITPDCLNKDASATAAEANRETAEDHETLEETPAENEDISVEDKKTAEMREQRLHRKYFGESAPALDEDGDIMFGFTSEGVYCDSNCGLRQNKWTQPLFYCLVCADTDLCQACYQDRLAQNRGEQKGRHWREVCGKDHRYIKGPIKGWRGVKDGSIRVEGREDVQFVDWLKNLEEVRWKEAWDLFWRRHGDVKDVLG